MPTDTVPLRKNRHKLIVDARAILDKADEEKRTLTAEDRQQYDKIMADAEELRTKIDDQERRNNLEREEQAAKMRMEENSRRKTEEGRTTAQAVFNPHLATEEYRSAYAKYLTAPNGTHIDQRMFSDEERRALSAGTGTEGGYLYASEVFANEIISDLTDATIYRQLARSIPIGSADSLGVPTITDRMSAAEWTSELGAASEDSTLAFGKRAITPHPLAKEIKVSKTLLRKVPAADAFVRGELARVVAEANENAFMTGNGVQKPLGIFTASNDGIGTARDVATGNTATTPTFDGLKRAKGTLKEPYLAKATWVFHRDIMTLIELLKDGNGRYLLTDSVREGEPDVLLGRPVRRSEYAPNTITASAYVGILGDHSNYWVVDAMDMQIQRAEELYIRSNQDLFIIRMETDGAPIKAEAFVRVKLGT